MTSVLHYLLLLVQVQVVISGVVSRSPPKRMCSLLPSVAAVGQKPLTSSPLRPSWSVKNLLSSRNCFFSPTQCFLPRVFDKYTPAENTSSMLGRHTRRTRLHHHRALAYLSTSSSSKTKLLQQIHRRPE